MSGNTGRHPITLQRVVYRIPGMESVPVSRDVTYSSGSSGPLTLDVYHPIGAAADELAPVVVIVTGYPDVSVPRPLGCAFKDMGMWISLAQLVAASGMSAVTYTSQTPESDLHGLIDYLTTNGVPLRLDPARIGLWAVSGHVPVALATLARQRRGTIRAAVLSTGFTLDLTASAVADASRAYGFANASAGMPVSDLPATVPLFLARAGRDENPGLNEAMDRFVLAALEHNLPVTLVNHATARHAFEINDDTAVSRHLVRQMLSFMQFWLRR